jgi:Tol biopolymer transport system component
MATALAVAAWALLARPGDRLRETMPVMRLEMNLPAGVEMFAGATRPVAISADGSRVAFIGVAAGTRRVFVRGLDRFDATPVRGSENAMACVFSPDGRSIAFVTSAGALKAISLADGLVATLASDATFINGMAWSADGSIVFVRNRTLWQMGQSGGTPKALTTLDGTQHDTLHSWPTVVPDGKTLLFSATAGDDTRIDALVLATGVRRTVVERGTMPLATAEGQLLFVRDGELLLAAFDAASLALTGPPIRAIDNLPESPTGTPSVDVSRSGTLVYAPTTAVSRLMWVSRQGVEEPLNDEPRSYANPRLSPDGSRVVVQAGDFWIQDLTRFTFTRLSSRSTTSNGFPEWTPDGRHVIFRTSNGLRLQDADGSGETQSVGGTTEFDYPSAITPDGETLLFMRSTPDTSFDVFTLPLRDPVKATPIIRTAAYEGGARLSPDRRWLIYVSNESGQNEIYLREFTGSDRRWQVSTQGGIQAMWNPNGKEIFYRNADKMMAVTISTSPTVVLSRPQALFEQRYAFGAGITIPNYDVSRDGRFVMIKDDASAGRLNVEVNWLPSLARHDAAAR